MKKHKRNRWVCLLFGWVFCAGLVFVPVKEGLPKVSDWETLQPSTFEGFDPRYRLRDSKAALKRKEAEVGPESYELCPTLEELGWLYLTFGQFEESQKQFLRGLQIAQKETSAGGEETALRLRAALLSYHMAIYDQEMADQLAHEIQALLRFDGPEAGLTAHLNALDSVTAYLRYVGQYEEAQALYLRALVALKKRGSIFTPWLRWNYGESLYLEGRFDQARFELEQALAEEQGSDYETSTLVPKILVSLASTELCLENSREALTHCKEAMIWGEKAFGSGRFAHKMLAEKVAVVYRRAGRPLEAEEHFRFALSAYEILGIVPFQTATIYRTASFYAGMGQFEDAAALLGKLLEANVPVLGENHFLIAHIKTGLGAVWRDWGIMLDEGFRLERAEKYLTESRDILERWPFAETWECIPLYRELARLYLAQREYARGEALLTRSIRIIQSLRGEHSSVLYWLYRDLVQCYRSIGAREKANRLEEHMRSLPILPEDLFFF